MISTFNHHTYNSVMLCIMDEEDSLEDIKDYAEKVVKKYIWKLNGQSTTDWAKYAAANNLWYPVTIYRDDQPHCYITFGKEFIEVRFLDERLFEYVYMSYKKMDHEKMFLSKVYVREYYHKADNPLRDVKKDIEMIFTVKGGLRVSTRDFLREERLKVITENMEAAHPVNVSQNWKSIPNYGEYDDISDYEDIIKPGDLLRGIDTSLKNPDAEGSGDKPDPTQENRWLPPDWGKN